MPQCKLHYRANAIYGLAPLVLMAAIALLPVLLWADIYRCVSDDGVVIFKWEKSFTPPAMQHTTRLKRIRPGVWCAPER